MPLVGQGGGLVRYPSGGANPVPAQPAPPSYPSPPASTPPHSTASGSGRQRWGPARCELSSEAEGCRQSVFDARPHSRPTHAPHHLFYTHPRRPVGMVKAELQCPSLSIPPLSEGDARGWHHRIHWPLIGLKRRSASFSPVKNKLLHPPKAWKESAPLRCTQRAERQFDPIYEDPPSSVGWHYYVASPPVSMALLAIFKGVESIRRRSRSYIGYWL